MAKNISILGSTGSIGTQTLDVVREIGGINVKAITANNNIELLEKQIREFNPDIAAVMNEEMAEKRLPEYSAAIESIVTDIWLNEVVGKVN